MSRETKKGEDVKFPGSHDLNHLQRLKNKPGTSLSWPEVVNSVSDDAVDLARGGNTQAGFKYIFDQSITEEQKKLTVTKFFRNLDEDKIEHLELKYLYEHENYIVDKHRDIIGEDKFNLLKKKINYYSQQVLKIQAMYKDERDSFSKLDGVYINGSDDSFAIPVERGDTRDSGNHGSVSKGKIAEGFRPTGTPPGTTSTPGKVHNHTIQ